MERNTVLAIALSALVLFTYESIFAPKRPQLLKETQHPAAQELNTNTPAPASILPSTIQETTEPDIKAINYEIQSPTSDFEYTNMGGSLHNMAFKGQAKFPVTDILDVNSLESVSYNGEKTDNSTISLVYLGKDLQVTKIFEHKDPNFITVRMEIKNLSEISILNNFSILALRIDNSRLENNANSSRENALYEYSVSYNGKIFRKGSAYKFGDKEYKDEKANVNWVGFRDHYNALIVKPEFETKGFEIKPNTNKDLSIFIKLPDKTLASGETETYEFSIYAGPQNPSLMAKYGKGFDKIVAFSSFAVIEWIAQAIYHIIPFFHSIFRSWGVAIILISLMIYGITYPLTMKSMMSMRKMQEVQPKIAALRERYKDDPQKLNTEMMEIYRREKINPLGGCLPFLIQMPFFMALYQILWRAQYFQGQGFLWIKDLSQPDHLFTLPFSLPFIGNEFNILPILTGCVMFLQQKISSKNMIVTDEQQVMQQKMMMYLLPVMMAFMFYKFASSWAIYFLIFYILSTLTQWRISQMAGKK